MALVKKVKIPVCCPIKKIEIITPNKAPMLLGLSNFMNLSAVKSNCMA
jgi:hypothetical protein